MMYRDLYRRIVIWQPITGMVVDLAPRYALAGATPTETEQRTAVADGRSVATRRSRVFEVPIARAEEHEGVALMKRLGCPVRLVALGAARHVLWQEDTNLQSVPERQGPLGMAPERVRMEFGAFDAAIFQGQDLLHGIPWAGASSADEDGTFVLTHSSLLGYEGPWWEVADGDSVDAQGAFDGDEAMLEMELPIPGATVRLDSSIDGGIEGKVEALGWDGDVIDWGGVAEAFELPEKTWSVRVQLESAADVPRLHVVRAGTPRGARPGEVTSDCDTRATAPLWTQTALTLTGEDVEV